MSASITKNYMTNTEKIADALIAQSRGILSLPGKQAADTIIWPLVEAIETHIMPIEVYEKRFLRGRNGS